jgi:hypothetical protein
MLIPLKIFITFCTSKFARFRPFSSSSAYSRIKAQAVSPETIRTNANTISSERAGDFSSWPGAKGSKTFGIRLRREMQRHYQLRATPWRAILSHLNRTVA